MNVIGLSKAGRGITAYTFVSNRTIVLDLGRQTKLLKIRNPCFENSETALPYLDMSMLLRNGSFPLCFILCQEIKASKRCASINLLAGITTKMGKNFAVNEAVVGKIKTNMICSRSVVHVVGACHKCRINFKWSNDTTTEEKVEGVQDTLFDFCQCAHLGAQLEARSSLGHEARHKFQLLHRLATPCYCL